MKYLKHQHVEDAVWKGGRECVCPSLSLSAENADVFGVPQGSNTTHQPFTALLCCVQPRGEGESTIYAECSSSLLCLALSEMFRQFQKNYDTQGMKLETKSHR